MRLPGWDHGQPGATAPDEIGTGTFTISNSFAGVGKFGARWTTGGAGLAKINGNKNVFISDATDAPPSRATRSWDTLNRLCISCPSPLPSASRRSARSSCWREGAPGTA